jgi:NTE family protein
VTVAKPCTSFLGRASRWVACWWLALALPLHVLAQTPDGNATSAVAVVDRPKVGLVLSGGGARGFAHVGVLRALRDLRVPVDIVVGTSMGSVVGAAHAAGVSVETMERTIRETTWDNVLASRPPRDQIEFRRREEDLELPSQVDLAVSRQGLSLPPSAAGNAALENTLARLLPPGAQKQPAQQLGLPFRATASDLLTGDLVTLADVPLLLAVRASASVPGVFTPVRVNGRLLVDGGLVRNLPVDLARSLGADIIIAVNLGTPLAPEESLSTSFGVAQQMLNILTEQNVQRSLKELRRGDVLISPAMGTLGLLDFQLHERAMQAGEEATRQQAAALAPLAVSPSLYARAEQSRQSMTWAAAASTALPLSSVAVTGVQRINPEALISQSGLTLGARVTPIDVEAAATRLQGRTDVERVDVTVSDAEGQRNVALAVTESAWAHNRARVGMALSSNFSNDNSFALLGIHTATSLNAWGAEWRTTVRLGTRRTLATEWWQPLGVGARGYVVTNLSYNSGTENAYLQGRRLARLGLKVGQMELALGYQLGEWGDVRLGVRRSAVQGTVLIPQDPPRGGRFVLNTRYAQWRIDTLEPLTFPVRGQTMRVLVTQDMGSNGQGTSPSRTQITGLQAFSLGPWGGHVYGEWARSRSGEAPLALGGFLRLSGTESETIDGSTVAFARLVLARRVADMPALLGGAVRAGFSLELGQGVGPDQSLGFGPLRRAGSLFLSLDTRLGPVYLGAGSTRGGGGAFYLFLGPIW